MFSFSYNWPVTSVTSTTTSGLVDVLLFIIIARILSTERESQVSLDCKHCVDNIWEKKTVKKLQQFTVKKYNKKTWNAERKKWHFSITIKYFRYLTTSINLQIKQMANSLIEPWLYTEYWLRCQESASDHYFIIILKGKMWNYASSDWQITQ